jgi:hypothetical protein
MTQFFGDSDVWNIEGILVFWQALQLPFLGDK